MRIKLTILASCLTLLAGCANTSIYVLDQKEVVRVMAGQNITAKYTGWLLSDNAVKRVINAKINAINLE